MLAGMGGIAVCFMTRKRGSVTLRRLIVAEGCQRAGAGSLQDPDFIPGQDLSETAYPVW